MANQTEEALLLRTTQQQVLRALAESPSRLNTRDIAARCGLLVNEVRWACRWLTERGLLLETKKLMTQSFGDKKARRSVAFWSMTAAGRDVAGSASATTATCIVAATPVYPPNG